MLTPEALKSHTNAQTAEAKARAAVDALEQVLDLSVTAVLGGAGGPPADKPGRRDVESLVSLKKRLKSVPRRPLLVDGGTSSLPSLSARLADLRRDLESLDLSLASARAAVDNRRRAAAVQSGSLAELERTVPETLRGRRGFRGVSFSGPRPL